LNQLPDDLALTRLRESLGEDGIACWDFPELE